MWLIVLLFVVSVACSLPANAQQSMEDLLNQVDKGFRSSDAGRQRPAVGAQGKSGAPSYGTYGAPGAGSYLPRYTQQPRQFVSPASNTYARQSPGSLPASPNLLSAFFGPQSAPVQRQPAVDGNPFFSRQNLLRAFLGGAPTSNNAGNSSATGSISGDLQQALDQAAQAEDAASRARYGEKDMRSSAADEAQNHANAARAAADRATSAASGTSLQTNDLAAQARNAANRAQAAADTAKYNASLSQ